MKGLNVIITDLSGYSFEVKWKRHIHLVKHKITEHYKERTKNDFCKEVGIARHEFRNYATEYLASYHHNKAETYNNIDLIYNGEVLRTLGLKKTHITCPDIQKNNHMNIIIKMEESEFDSDSDSDWH